LFYDTKCGFFRVRSEADKSPAVCTSIKSKQKTQSRLYWQPQSDWPGIGIRNNSCCQQWYFCERE